MNSVASLIPDSDEEEHAAVIVQDDLERILALPQRQPVSCSLDPITKRYDPKAQALINAMTKRLGRGKRLSCACRPRIVKALPGGMISVTRILPEDVPPEPPLFTTVSAFVADTSSVISREVEVTQQVSRLRPGEEVKLPAAEGEYGHFCFDTLNAVQAWALYEIPKEAGGIGLCGVGSGKSGLFILMPIALGSECELAVLFIEPNQRNHYVSQYLRVREHFKVGSIIFEDGTKPFLVPGTPTLHLLSYSKFSNPKHPDELDVLNANVILADEAHRLTGKVRTTGRTRLRRYITKKIKERQDRIDKGLPVKRRAVYLIPMSGTLEDKSVEDMQAVAVDALGMSSPLPLDKNEAQRWSQIFDPVRNPDRKSATAHRLQAAFAGRVWASQDISTFLEGEGPEKYVREGYCKRRNETPGVISSSATEVGASLYFRERKAPKIPDIIQAALKQIRDKGIRPDGEVILGDNENNIEAMKKIVAKQVSVGMYLYWAFPKIPCTCKGKDPRCDGCKLIERWFSFRKPFRKELRGILSQSSVPVHLDSPKMCEDAAIRAMEDTSAPAGLDVYCVDCREAWPCGKAGHLPAWRSTHWKAWNEIEDKVPHESRVKWIGWDLPEAADDATHPGYFLARDAAKYALEDPSVLWFSSVAFGQKVSQLAKLPYHGGGPDSEALIRAETGKRSVVASIRAHGKGLDHLQNYFDEQLIMEMPSSNRIMEQLLGRLLRRGQKADRIMTYYYAHVVEMRDALRKVKMRAEFNQTMSGNKALILAADFDDE